MRRNHRNLVWLLAIAMGATALPTQTVPLVAQSDDSKLIVPGSNRERTIRSRRGARASVEPESNRGAIETSATDSEAKITAGKILVRDLIRFIGVHSGKLILFPSFMNDPHFAPDHTIDFVTDHENFNETTARAALTANGFVLTDTTLQNGEPVIRMTHRSSRSSTPPVVPSLVIGPNEPLPEGKDDESAMLVVSVENTDVVAVGQSLREIFHVASPSQSDMSIVVAFASNQLVVRAPISTLRTVRTLVGHLDRKDPRPRPVQAKEAKSHR